MESDDLTGKDNKKNKIKCKKLDDLTDEDIEEHLKERLSFTGKGIDIFSRYSAYDYCYNCFRDVHEKGISLIGNETIKETLCLQLGLFLGTWGMFRNSDLQKCSFRIYEPLIIRVFEEEALWNIDVDKYCEKSTWKAIVDFKEKIKASLPFNVSNTLATKIMMVVFGCVPAYDRNFRETLEHKTFNEESLKDIYNFYDKKKGLLDPIQKELKTVKVDGGLTDYTYTMAKIIDIIGFHVTEELDIEDMKIKPAMYKNGKPKGISIWDDRENRKQKRIDKMEKLLKELNIELKDC